MTQNSTISLNGEWQLTNLSDNRSYPGVVPGCVHSDLLRNEIIPDPYYRKNELDLQWIGETDWKYERVFTIDKHFLADHSMILKCDGLDTFAEIVINGKAVAKTDNMFITYKIPIKEYLLAGENKIEFIFTSVLPYMKKRNAERHLGVGEKKIKIISD